MSVKGCGRDEMGLNNPYLFTRINFTSHIYETKNQGRHFT